MGGLLRGNAGKAGGNEFQQLNRAISAEQETERTVLSPYLPIHI
jgi:hypothetical protein